ncbi:MAG: N-acetyl-gamma-glutamyl-phosphate reductase [Pelolinea sp.]|nr:N-acetyl-gamma-glutamyl-phosphate reductase [Pelolinea sp.]
MKNITVGVYGGTGYSGWELIQLLLLHPHVELKFITSERKAGKNLADVWPRAPGFPLQSASEVDLKSVDYVFLCLPHTQSAPIATQAKAAGCSVIDLSADLRLNDPADFALWYGVPHAAPDLLPVVYGLSEFYRETIMGAKLVANPGCYATAVLLGLLPLAQAGLLAADVPIIVDAKSGTTGAGRAPKQHLLFSEVSANLTPYKIGRAHPHIGEIEQQLAVSGVGKGCLIFSPHLLPTDRGILASIYAPVQDAQQAAAAIQQAHQFEPMVKVLPQGELASLAHVIRTPYAVLSVTPVPGNMLIIMSAVDNLLKGAASQALQNFNLMAGFPETTALLPPSNIETL